MNNQNSTTTLPEPRHADGSFRLYHFTASRLWPKIRNAGITKGAISLFDKEGYLIGLAEGWIWLTQNGLAKEQGWHTTNLISYDRTAVRLTIEIPVFSAHKVFHAPELLQERFPGSVLLLEWPGSDDWWLYRGRIWRRWITDVKYKPGASHADGEPYDGVKRHHEDLLMEEAITAGPQGEPSEVR